MPVRREHCRERARSDRPIQIAGDQEAGEALKVDLLDGVIGLGDLAEDLRRQRRAIGHWQQAGGCEDVLPQIRCPLLPFDGIRESRRRVLVVERAESRLAGERGRGQDQ
jgi:hypothetical protein